MPAGIQSHMDNFSASIVGTGNPNTGITPLDFSVILVIDSLANSTQSGMTSTTVGANASKLTVISDGDTMTSSIGAAAQLAISNVFAPREHHPASVRLLSVDLVGGDTWETALLALEGVWPDYFAVVVPSTTQSVIADIVDGVTQAGMSKERVVFASIASTSDATAANGTWVGGTLGAQSAAEKAILFLTYHDLSGSTAADYAEYAGRILTHDFDRKCPSGNMVMTNQPVLANLASVTAKNNLDENFINHILPMPGTTTYLDPGCTLDGTPIYALFTRLWLEDRLSYAAAKVKVDLLVYEDGSKLTVDRDGSAKLRNALQKVIDDGVGAKHLLSADDAKAQNKAPPFVRVEPIVQADIDARRIRYSVLQYRAEDARQIVITGYLRT